MDEFHQMVDQMVGRFYFALLGNHHDPDKIYAQYLRILSIFQLFWHSNLTDGFLGMEYAIKYSAIGKRHFRR